MNAETATAEPGFELEAVPASQVGVGLEVTRLKDSPHYLGLVRNVFDIGRLVKELQVKDEESEKAALNVTAEVVTLKESIETFRKSITEWPRYFVTTVNKLFGLLTDDLDKIRASVDGKIRPYQFKKQLEARKQQAELIRQAEATNKILDKKGLPPIPIPDKEPPVETTVRSESGTQYQTQEWHWEEKNKLLLIKAVAEGKEKPEALDINAMYIQGQIDAGVRRIPGVRIYEETVTKFRRR